MASGYVICQICESYHDNIEKLNEHYDSDHPQTSGPKHEQKFRCDQCDKRFTRKERLEYHTRRIHYVTADSPLGEFQCNQCDKRYVKRETLKSHMKKVHDVTLPLLSSGPRRSHISDEHLKNERKFQCDHCEKRFTEKKGLAHHKKRAHYVTAAPPQGEFKCNECEKRYANRYDLRRHMLNAHDVTLPALR